MENNKKRQVKIIVTILFIVLFNKLSKAQTFGGLSHPTEPHAGGSLVVYVNHNNDCANYPGYPFAFEIDYNNTFFPTFESGIIAPAVKGIQQSTGDPIMGEQYDEVSQYYIMPYKIQQDYNITPSSLGFQIMMPAGTEEDYTTTVNTFGKGNPGMLICPGTYGGAYTAVHSAAASYTGAIYLYNPDYGKLEMMNTLQHQQTRFTFVTDTDLAKIGIIKTPNTTLGSVGISNSSIAALSGVDVTVLADASGNATLDFFWQGETAYCNEVFAASVGGQIKIETLYQDGTVSGTQTYNPTIVYPGDENKYKANTVTVNGIGKYEFIIRMKDHWGHEYYTDPVIVEVLPGCYGQSAQNVTVTGTDLITINNGYGNALGSYRLEKDHEYTLNFGTVNNFCAYYEVLVGDGINVAPPSQTDPCFPAVATSTPNTGIQVTRYLPGNTGFTFIPRDQVSGYKIDVLKRPNLSAMEGIPTLGNMCPNFQPIVFTVGGQNEHLKSNCLITLAPSTVPKLFPGVAGYTDIYSVLQYFDYTVQSAKGVIIQSEGGEGIFLKDGATLQIIESDDTDIPLAETVDNDKNWIQSQAFDDDGRLISESKSFFDNRGRTTQSQVKNLTNGVVMANQILYDKYGRTALTTLPAPIRALEQTQAVDECGDDIQQGQDLYFIYKSDFITSGGLSYKFINFDDVGTNTRKNNPDPVDNTVPGTLGWYYGPNNTAIASVDQSKNQQRFIEPYVAQTSFPYSRNTYLEDGTNESFSSSLPGDQHRIGTGRQASSLTTALTTSDKAMLSDYLLIRGLHVFPGITNNPTNLDNKAFHISTKDIEQDETIFIQDEEGRTLISYHVASGNKSFMYYDLYGRVVCTITPNGLEKLLADKTNTSLYQDIDKTTNKYNYKGWLIEINEKDFGTTKFMYRLDGTLRYSQNDKQKLTNSFAYTLYDYSGRAIESGLFTPSSGSDLLFNSAALKLTLEENSTNEKLTTGGTKSEVVYTVYDLPDQAAINNGDITTQSFLRGKISYNYRVEDGTGNIIKTWFSYDERGRIVWAAQQIPGLATSGVSYGVKKISYIYASNGSVSQVAYNGSMSNDNFYHVYYYDLDNRLNKVFTCKDQPVYNSSGELTNGTLQASYNYYLHGGFKRLELAENLQGLDYVYTPQGWLKSFNYPNTAQDPGKDGTTNSAFPEDVFAIRYDYFTNDYQKTATNIGSEQYYNSVSSPYKQYYNGNIMGVSWMTKNQTGAKIPAAYGYEYDERYQLKNADYLSVTLGTGSSLSPIFSTAKFQERNINYDANGNILGLLRTKADASPLHNFQYQYKNNSNQLELVNNLIGASVYATYTYDAIGQLHSVTQNGQTKYVQFDNRGMLTVVSTDEAGAYPIVKFYYDDKGLRYKKEAYNASNHLQSTTYYIHDVAKNTLAVYDNNNTTSSLEISELSIYGADRIGLLTHPGSSAQYQYELKDHLGNVRAVVSPIYSTADPLSFMSSFEGDDLATYGNDYSAFVKVLPSTVPSLNGTKVLALRFPDQAQNIAYKKLLKTGDRLTSASIEAYVPAAGINAGHLTAILANASGEMLYYDANHLLSAMISSIETGAVSAWSMLTIGELIVPSVLYDSRGEPEEDIYLSVYVSQTAESGNTEIYYDQLQLNITYASHIDKTALQGLIAYTNYYPYGMPMEDKYINGEGYRYGYQGQYAEKDEETQWNSFELRMYDAVIGKWLSVDPKRSGYSKYWSMDNNPVKNIDPDGGDPPLFGYGNHPWYTLMEGFRQYFEWGTPSLTWAPFTSRVTSSTTVTTPISEYTATYTMSMSAYEIRIQPGKLFTYPNYGESMFFMGWTYKENIRENRYQLPDKFGLFSPYFKSSLVGDKKADYSVGLRSNINFNKKFSFESSSEFILKGALKYSLEFKQTLTESRKETKTFTITNTRQNRFGSYIFIGNKTTE
jgi:RHS repeat-associated protein